jgi:hypothetical protein
MVGNTTGVPICAGIDRVAPSETAGNITMPYTLGLTSVYDEVMTAEAMTGNSGSVIVRFIAVSKFKLMVHRLLLTSLIKDNHCDQSMLRFFGIPQHG